MQAPRRERGSARRQLHTTRKRKRKKEQKKVHEADSPAGRWGQRTGRRTLSSGSSPPTPKPGLLALLSPESRMLHQTSLNSYTCSCFKF